MRLFIQCDSEGNIVSAMQVNFMAEGLEHPYGDVAEKEMVIELKPSATQKAMACHEICEQYTIDTKKKKLKKITSAGKTKK